MHENELEINEGLVYSLIKNQCPEWANLPLERITSSGTDNALFRLGSEHIVRLPRVEWETGSVDKSINKEYEWLPKIAPFLQVPISLPVFKGSPNHSYPHSWLVAKWNEGHPVNFEKDNEHELLAKDLACFLNELHGIILPNGPTSRRGVPLKKVDTETRMAISQLQEEVSIERTMFLWNQLLNVLPWNKGPVWVHGDFLPGNILVQNYRLSAVIDFSDVGIGDPACDLIISWALLNPQSRKTFKDNLNNIDEDTWERGRGWALSIALIMLPYYKNTNSVLTALARQMIKNVLKEENNE